MTFSKKQIDAMCKAISDLVDDLHDNHEYDKNFFDHIDCPHGYRYVVTLLKLLQRHPHYSEWARGYLEAYAFEMEDIRADAELALKYQESMWQ